MMMGKREMLARASQSSGFTRLLEWTPKQRVLMILNYHRIGNAAETPYDSGTFSATTEEFDWQIQYLKRHFPIVCLEEALSIVKSGTKLRSAAVLITFDDGYRDNYTQAFPVLRTHKATATFFLPTAFIGTGDLPWWDVIAFLVKKTRNESIRLDYPETATFHLNALNRNRTIDQVLDLFKRPYMDDPQKFLANLAAACGVARPDSSAERCFLSWEEAREMQANGMTFGSHTHSHPVLSQISRERQKHELQLSRDIIQRELNARIDALAYPVGLPSSFTRETAEAAAETGYSAAFSYYGGFNRPGVADPLNICRWPVAEQSRALLRLQTAIGTATGRLWP